MKLVIDFSAQEETRLLDAAMLSKISPEELVKNILLEHLPSSERPIVTSTKALFEKWAKEDQEIPDEERAENDHIYAEIEKNGIPRLGGGH